MRGAPVLLRKGKRGDGTGRLTLWDGAGRPVGLLDITDLIGLVPIDQAAALGQVA